MRTHILWSGNAHNRQVISVFQTNSSDSVEAMYLKFMKETGTRRNQHNEEDIANSFAMWLADQSGWDRLDDEATYTHMEFDTRNIDQAYGFWEEQ